MKTIDCLRLGAIDIETKRHTFPVFASKSCKYVCVDCKEPVILKQGKIKRHHFAHKPGSDCTYYEHCNESQVHKEAKLILAQHLTDRKPLAITYDCLTCNKSGVHSIQYTEKGKAILEHYDKQTKCKYDVAYLETDELQYVFEVLHSHATTSFRPEPWFELKATDIIYMGWSNTHVIKCHRGLTLRNCETCTFLNDSVWNDVPYVTDMPCLICDTHFPKYSVNWIGAIEKELSICPCCFEYLQQNRDVGYMKDMIPLFWEKRKQFLDDLALQQANEIAKKKQKEEAKKQNEQLLELKRQADEENLKNNSIWQCVPYRKYMPCLVCDKHFTHNLWFPTFEHETSFGIVSVCTKCVYRNNDSSEFIQFITDKIPEFEKKTRQFDEKEEQLEKEREIAYYKSIKNISEEQLLKMISVGTHNKIDKALIERALLEFETEKITSGYKCICGTLLPHKGWMMLHKQRCDDYTKLRVNNYKKHYKTQTTTANRQITQFFKQF